MKISVRITDAAKKFIGWRGLYPSEGGNNVDVGMPAVIPSDMQDGFDFTCDMQTRSWELMDYFNSVATRSKWRQVYKYNVAFTNEQGFDKPNDPRADFVNNINVTSPLPKLMKGIVCSGSFYRGELIGDRIWMTPGIHAIDGNRPMPDIQTIINNNWFFYATSNTVKPSHFPQGADANIGYFGWVLIPYILVKPVYYPVGYFERWEADTLPDPLKIYL